MMTGFALSLAILFLLILMGSFLSILIKFRFSQKTDTPKEHINQILDLMSLTKDSHFIDLGAGDYRMVFAAKSRHKAQSEGVEISPWLIFISKLRKLIHFGIDSYPKVRVEDLQKIDLSEFDVIYANLDDIVIEGMIDNVSRTANNKAKLFLLNTTLDNIKPIKTVELDSKNKLTSYSIKKIRDHVTK